MALSVLEKGLAASIIILSVGENTLWIVGVSLNQSQSSWVVLNPGCSEGAPAKCYMGELVLQSCGIKMTKSL